MTGVKRGFAVFVLFLMVFSLKGKPEVWAAVQVSRTSAQRDTTRKKKTIKLFLDQIEVQGWIDRPQMVYVVPGINPEVDDILLDRSFLDEILRPLDKDKFERQKLIRKKIVIPW